MHCITVFFFILFCLACIVFLPNSLFCCCFCCCCLQQFERYFAANDVKKQGSFYLQSKIYRAHELLMEFQAEKHKQDVNGGK